MDKLEFEKSLVDVRRAYRLLYLYQRRVMDIVQFVGTSFDFKFEGGWPWYSDPTPHDYKVKLDNWSWDWLNMYFYEFGYKPKKLENGDKLYFSMFIQSDTGYYDNKASEENRPETFASVQDSATQIILLAGLNCEWMENAFKDDFEKRPYKLFESGAADYCKTDKESGKVLLGRAVPLSRFINQAETEQVLEEWRAYCEGNGILEFKSVE
jgi:hypothetical protein